MLKNIRHIVIVAISAVSLVSCYDPTVKAEADNTTKSTGVEYAPQMYHSEAYDPMTQVTEKDAGSNYFPWILVGGGESDYSEVKDGHGEFYNSNYYNEHGMNMRTPNATSVARGELPYRLAKEDIELASNIQPTVDAKGNLTIAYVADSTNQLPEFDMAEAKALYQRFCSHCHGKTGMADGKVGEKFGGVPVYASAALKDLPIGHIFHVITHGKGRMGAHASQLSQEERWKIATFVQTLQKQ